MNTRTTIANLLAVSADRVPTAPAIVAPNRPDLSYQKFYEHILSVVQSLNSMGIGRNDRVAVVLPDGPELAVAFVAVASGATCTTLNPSYTLDEFMTLFKRMKIAALIYQRGVSGEALNAAEKSGILTIELVPLLDAGAGSFTLQAEASMQGSTRAIETGLAGPDDIAQLAITSGTTSSVKIVPTSQDIYCARLLVGLQHLPLTPEDRLLNVMPLFHPAGLNHVVRSFVAGSSVVCLPGFEVAGFFNILDEFRPTWFSAVATMCQAIVSQAPNYQQIVDRHRLRFIRAGSMALPVQVMETIERIFRVPVIQAYSSTEAGIIASGGMPPEIRKFGSVGLSLNLKVEIWNDSGLPVPPGEAGAVVVSGPTVVPGYEDDPAANAEAFVRGWYQTGDLGYFDEDGYLFITGRVKEVINRGGQKISPSEIEETFLKHPAVQQAVAFGMPDELLGEEVAIAVTLTDSASINEDALRLFAQDHLATYKIPRKIVILTEIPKNAVGKFERKKLAEKLGLRGDSQVNQPPSDQPLHPHNATQARLIDLWAEILSVPASKIGIQDQFRALGGVSLSAARLIFKAREAFGVNVTIVDFFDASTIAKQAEIIEKLKQNGSAPATTIIPIRAEGTRVPLYCFHALKGGVYIYQMLLPYLHPDQPVYGLQAVGIDDGKAPFDDVQQAADYHCQQIKTIQLKGPYFLCGYSFGGRLALEVARRLWQDGHRDVYVLIIDDHLQKTGHWNNRWSIVPPLNFRLVQSAYNLSFALLLLPPAHRQLYIRQKLRYWRNKAVGAPKGPGKPDWLLHEDEMLPDNILRVKNASTRAANSYVPLPYDGPIIYLRASSSDVSIKLFQTLRYIANGPLEVIDIPGSHDSLLHDPDVTERVGIEIQKWLDRVNTSRG